MNVEIVNTWLGELDAADIEVRAHVQVWKDRLEFTTHVPDYAAAVAVMRKYGRRTWEKNPNAPPSISWISSIEDSVEITVFFSGLPPTCRLVEKIERIRKTETVDTGEFIEVKRTVIECGEEKS